MAGTRERRTDDQSSRFISLTDLDCSICNHGYEPEGDHQPKMLKCGHTLCIECIGKMVDTMGVKCPYCFAVTPVGIMGINALPVNVALTTLVNNLQIQELKDEVAVENLCCACNVERAVKICFSCDPTGCKLCEACCTREHERDFAPIRAHRPILIRDAEDVHRNTCHIHESQPLTHYCKKTGTLACLTCLDGYAENIRGSCEPIEAVAHSFKLKLAPVMQKLEKYLERVQDSHHRISIIQGQLRQAGPKTVQDIQTQFAKFQTIFKERQKTLLNNAESYISFRKEALGGQLSELRTITKTVMNQKEKLRDLMQQDDRGFLVKFRNTFENTCVLLDAENPALQRPVHDAKISIYIPPNFTEHLHTVGSVGGGPVVINCKAQTLNGLLKLTWAINNTDHPVTEYEIEYQTVPVLFDSDGPSYVKCNGNAFQRNVNCLCPGYTYTFRMRSAIFSGWGMWTKPFVGKYDDFPCTISHTGTIVQVKIPDTGRYQITAKGAKAADGKYCNGGRGAIVSAVFTLQKGDILDILCGGMSECQGFHSGGAGGTFVSVNTRELEGILVVAGGGGGTRGYNSEDPNGCDASLEPHGTMSDASNCAEGGLNGSPGQDATFAGPPWGFGGAGWQKSSTTAYSFVEGGYGGECGGFGGGGGVGMYGGGGGGGYSGGGGGRGGGGGGSYVREDGDNITKEVGNMHHGEVTIEKLIMSGNSSSNNSKEINVLSPTATSNSSSSKDITMLSPSTSVSSTSEQ